MRAEENFRKRFALLRTRMLTMTAGLDKAFLASMTRPKVAEAYWRPYRAEFRRLYREGRKSFREWSKEEIPREYGRALEDIQASLDADRQFVMAPRRTIQQMKNIRATNTLETLLARQADADFAAGLEEGLKDRLQLTRMTQQTLIRESELERRLLMGLADTGDVVRAARVMSGDLYKRLIDSSTDELFVRAGRYRYKPEYYAELVARTKFHEAQSLATLAQAKNYGTDLVRVSGHGTTTDVCLQYEGQTFSISGNTPGYPRLDNTPPFHPNCLHNLFPEFDPFMAVPALRPEGALMVVES